MGDVKFSIRVIDKNNSPCSNIKVTVFDSGFLGTQYDSGYTNSDGWLSFEFYCVSGKFNADIKVQDKVLGEGIFYNGDTRSFVY